VLIVSILTGGPPNGVPFLDVKPPDGQTAILLGAPFPTSTAAVPRPAHKSNARKPDYHPDRAGPLKLPAKPDISPDRTWRLPMKTIILAAFAALSLGVGMAQAQTLATGAATRPSFHQTIPTAQAFDSGWGNG
jgi:hypothetical protein